VSPGRSRLGAINAFRATVEPILSARTPIGNMLLIDRRTLVWHNGFPDCICSPDLVNLIERNVRTVIDLMEERAHGRGGTWGRGGAGPLARNPGGAVD
jgi:hypothetical protein